MSNTGLALLAIAATVASAYAAVSWLRNRVSAGNQSWIMPPASVVYRISMPWRMLLIAGGAALSGGALVAAVVCSDGFFARGPGWGMATVVGVTVGVLAGAYIVIDTLLSKLSIGGDVAEVYDLSGARRFSREDFASRFVLTHHSVRTLICIPKDSGQRRLKLPMLFASNDEVEVWFSSIPSLESVTEEALQSRIAADTTLGSSPDARLGHLASARKRAVIARWVCLGVGGWAWFAPRPYSLVVVVLIAIPWIAVYVAGKSRGLYTLNGSTKDRRPDLSTPLLLPGFILLLREILDLNIVDWRAAAVWTVFATAALAMAAIRADPQLRSRRAAAITLTVLLGSYGYGGSLLANALADRGKPVRYTVRVRDKHVASGKSRTPELRLDPWGPVASTRDVAVSWRVYNATVTGGLACVELHSGVLGVNWYRVGGEGC